MGSIRHSLAINHRHFAAAGPLGSTLTPLAIRQMPGGLFCTLSNPLNDGTWTYTWSNGRQLTRMQSIDVDASFVYNESGLRVRKTVNGVVTDYTLHGKNVVHMTQGNDVLHFFYDAQNKPAMVEYNGNKYGYVHNLQGDVIALINSAGTVVVRYTYDAWGRPISCSDTMANTLGTVQPFRYRSYVYDEETGLDYLRSRYYKPEWCRFMNADQIIADNLFAYCDNCPVCKADPAGKEGIPEVKLYGINDLKHRLEIPAKDGKLMTNVEFAWVIRQMEYEKWKYDRPGDSRGMDYKSVDCVSVYRYVMWWYYYGYREFVPKDVYNVEQMIEHCCSALEHIQPDYSNLEIGMALFMKDKSGHHYHVGYYIGCGKVLESNLINKNGKVVVDGVRIIELAGSNFSESAYLNGIEYGYDINEEVFLCQGF